MKPSIVNQQGFLIRENLCPDQVLTRNLSNADISILNEECISDQYPVILDPKFNSTVSKGIQLSIRIDNTTKETNIISITCVI